MEELEKKVNEEENDIIEEDIIQLVNEDGETVDFYHVATIEYEDNWYVFFEPAEELADIDEGEVVIFKLETDEDGEDLFVPIEDDELLDRVFEEYNRLMEEEGCCCGDDDCHCEGDCHCGEEHHHEHNCDCHKK